MANSPVYDPETESGGEPTYRTPSDLGPGHTRAAGDPSDPRDVPKNTLDNNTSASGTADRSSLRNAESSRLFNPNDKEEKGGGLSPASLLGAESGGNKGGADGFNFNPGKNGKTGSSGFKNFFWGSTKRKRITIGSGAIISLLASGGILGLLLIAGPAQLVQLDEMLQRNFSGTNQASSSRMGQLVANARAQDIGETRLSLLGRQYFRGYRDALSEKGIDFNSNVFDQFGGKNAATIDTEKLKNDSPDLSESMDSMSPDQRAAYLEQRFDIPAGSLSYTGDGRFSVDASEWSDGQISGFLQSTIGILDNGFISNAIANRQFSKYFDNPNMFHIFEYAKSNIIRNLLNKADAKQAEQEEQEDEEKATIDQVGEPAGGAVGSVQEKAGTASDFATSALTYTGAACYMKDIGGDIITINRYRVVLPAAVMALRFIAIGEQVKSGQDISAAQMGAAEQSLNNSQGQSVWQGMAMQVTSGDQNPSGPDIPTEYQQAFDTNTTATSIESVADATLGGAAVATAACSRVGTIVQGAISVVQIVGSGALEVFSDGAATPGVAASLSSKFAAVGASIGVDAVKMASQVKALGFVQNFVVNKNASGSLAKDAFSGPLGGNLLAYGAREAANMGAIASGGIALSSSASNTYAAAQQQEDEHQFQSESLFARVFDVDDDRSLIGHLAQSISPSASQNVATMTTGFSSLGDNLLSSLSSLILPKTQAAANYDWTFPQYGIPTQMLSDPSLADPYANADAVGKILDASCTNSDGSVNTGCTYIKNANTCFGVGINKDSGGLWDVTTQGDFQTNDIDPNAAPYLAANCGDTSNTNWKRIIMFIFDMRTAQAAACYSGDNESCTDVGYGSQSSSSDTTTTSTTPSTPSGQTPSGNAQQLATQILALAKQGKISFAVVNPANENDDSTAEDNIKDTANGQPAQTSTSCLGGGVLAPNKTTPLSPTLLQFIVDLAGQENFTINELAGGCHDETNSNHYNGTAVDFGCPFDPGPADSVGQKYGISDGTGETCSTAGHYHYSIGGN